MIEYKVIELTSFPGVPGLEEELNKLSYLGFKISHIVSGYGTAGYANYYAKIILEREVDKK